MAESTVVALVFEDENDAERLFDTLQQTLEVASFPINNAAITTYRQKGVIDDLHDGNIYNSTAL